MNIRVLFVDWTKERLFKAVGLVLMLLFILFAWLNIGVGPTEEVAGTVRKLGMDTGVVFTLSRVVATVETEAGEIVSVEVPTTATVAIGNELILEKRTRLLTSGHDYRFLRPAK